MSDHCPIIHVHYSSNGAKTESYYTRRNMSHRNRLAFQNAISAIDWKIVYSETDMQNAFSLFHSKLIELYHKYFPKQKITYKYNNHKPWLCQALKEWIKINRILKIAGRKNYSDLIDGDKHNIKKTWQIIKILPTKISWENISLNLNWVIDQLHVANQLLVKNSMEFSLALAKALLKRSPNKHCNPYSIRETL